MSRYLSESLRREHYGTARGQAIDRARIPEGQRPWVDAIVARAYKQVEVGASSSLTRRLEGRYPSAAASVREGLDETLPILTLGLSDRLRQSLAATAAIESLISRMRHVKRNVKRWRAD